MFDAWFVLFFRCIQWPVDMFAALWRHASISFVLPRPSNWSNVHLVTENYGDLRKTPLFFAISNGDATCAELLLAARAKPDLDPLRCILVAVRAERWAAQKYICASSQTFSTEILCKHLVKLPQKVFFNSSSLIIVRKPWHSNRNNPKWSICNTYPTQHFEWTPSQMDTRA